MWVQLVALTVVALSVKSALRKLISRERHEAKSSGVRTAWKALYLALTNPGIPNYIMCDLVSKMYGRFAILKMHTVTEVTVLVAELGIVKDIMNAKEWVNRLPNNHFYHETTWKKPLGIVFGNGEYWRQARKLSLRLLHKCGFYNVDQMIKIITREYLALENFILSDSFELSQVSSRDLYCHGLFQLSSFNIISTIVQSRRFERGDPKVDELLKVFDEFNSDFNIGGSLVDLMPWLRYIPGMSYMDAARKHSETHFRLSREEMKKRRSAESQRENRQPDFLDYFLEELKNHSGDPIITEETLLCTVRDLLFAGTDTTSNTLEYAILYMVLYPQVQSRVQQEIDDVIGSSRRPNLSDRESMPYTQATMLEVLRLATPVPMSGRTSVTTNRIGEHTIPKDSMVAINLYSIHMNDQVWEDPQVFRPERFLSGDDGSLLVNTDKILPFGYGKRSCIGETPARITVFIFLTSLLQKFSFSLAESHGPPSLENRRGISRTPRPFWVRVTKRTCSPT